MTTISCKLVGHLPTCRVQPPLPQTWPLLSMAITTPTLDKHWLLTSSNYKPFSLPMLSPQHTQHTTAANYPASIPTGPRNQPSWSITSQCQYHWLQAFLIANTVTWLHKQVTQTLQAATPTSQTSDFDSANKQLWLQVVTLTLQPTQATTIW